MGKTSKQQLRSQHHRKTHPYQNFKGNRKEGQGFANVRKSQAVSRYHRDFAKEKLKLKDWSEKLQKLYAETDDISDDDDFQHLQYANRKETRRKIAETNKKSAEETGDICTVTHTDDSAQGQDTKFNATSSVSLSLGPKSRQKKNVKVSSYYKQEKDWKKKQEEKERRLKDIEERKEAKEAAIAKHRQEKIQRHKLLAKRNYKGQPNMASRMELLLNQIVKKHNT